MNKLTKLIVNSTMLFVFLIMASQTIAGEFAVSPMMIELQGTPRESKEFSFTLFGKSNTDVKISFFDMNQLETGYMGFNKSALDNMNTMASWIELDDDRMRLRENESVQVTGTITIPSRAAGSHQLAIMIEEDVPEESKGGISVKIRYAVVLTLDVNGRTNKRIQTQFEQLAVVELEDGTYLEGYFQNDSVKDDWLFSQVQLRGEDNRLLERVQMKTQSAWQRADAGSRVFPGAKVRLYGKITKPIKGGEYKVLVRNEFAGKSQPVYRDIFQLTGDVPTTPSADLSQDDSATAGNVMINPDAVAINIRANGTSFSSFYVVNDKPETVKVIFPTSMKNLESLGVQHFQFYPDNMEIKPGMRSRVVLRQNHLSDKKYENIRFQADLVTGSDKLILEVPTVEGSES